MSMPKSVTPDIIFESGNGSDFFLLIVNIMIKQTYFQKIDAKSPFSVLFIVIGCGWMLKK